MKLVAECNYASLLQLYFWVRRQVALVCKLEAICFNKSTFELGEKFTVIYMCVCGARSEVLTAVTMESMVFIVW